MRRRGEFALCMWSLAKRPAVRFISYLRRLADQLFGLPPSNGIKGSDSVRDFVTTHRHKIFRLRCPTGARLRIAGLEDTMYRDDDYEVKSWGAFYLPDEVKMQVLGVVEGTSCPYDQLVLMTCEDEKVYAYDGEELHVVASSWNKLCEEGIEYPASETYYDGEAFKHMTEEDWEEEWKSPLGQMFEEEHDKLVAEKKSEFLENLNLARQKRELQRQLQESPAEARS